MEVHPNAGKHGVAEDDIDHANRNALVVADLGDGRSFTWDRTGQP